jgi:hypothetical protein
VASALLRSYGTRVVGSAVASVVIGVAVVIGAYAVPRSRSATVDSPAPPPSAPPVSPVREKVYL